MNPQWVKSRNVDDYTYENIGDDWTTDDFYGGDIRVTDMVTGEDTGDFYR